MQLAKQAVAKFVSYLPRSSLRVLNYYVSSVVMVYLNDGLLNRFLVKKNQIFHKTHILKFTGFFFNIKCQGMTGKKTKWISS